MKPKTAKYAKLLNRNIAYQTLATSEQHGTKAAEEKSRDVIGRSVYGTPLAPIPAHTMARTMAREASDDNATIELISNAGTLEIPDESSVPNEYEFEILRLRRRVEELEGIVKDRDERNVKAIAMLEDEMQMWRTAMHAHVLPTHGQAQQRIIRIESTLQTLKEKESKFFPPLEIPKRWKK